MMCWVAIILAAVVYMGIGAWCYSPAMFGKIWMQAQGLSGEDLHATPKHYAGAAGVALVVSWGLMQILAWTDSGTLLGGLGVGLLVGLFIITPTQFSGVIWSGVPVKVFLINSGCFTVSTTLMGGLLGLFH